MSNFADELKKSADEYFSIIGGTLVVAVTEDTEGAIRREYEKSDGTKGVKYEKKYRNLRGVIVNMEFQDTDFGEQFRLSVSNGIGTAVLSMSTDSKYFSDFAKKLPNIDLMEELTLNPYDFTTDNDKRKTGFSIMQSGNKIESAYYDVKEKKNVRGMPEPEGDTKTFDKDDWKSYFIKVKKFLKKEVQAVVIPLKEATSKDVETVFDEMP